MLNLFARWRWQGGGGNLDRRRQPLLTIDQGWLWDSVEHRGCFNFTSMWGSSGGAGGDLRPGTQMKPGIVCLNLSNAIAGDSGIQVYITGSQCWAKCHQWVDVPLSSSDLVYNVLSLLELRDLLTALFAVTQSNHEVSGAMLKKASLADRL